MKPPQLFTIRAGARPRPCRGRTCRESVYDVKMPSGKLAPIHVNRHLHAECVDPTSEREGRGINHFVDCVDAPQFNTRKKVRGAE